jgi:hypothetical protein
MKAAVIGLTASEIISSCRVAISSLAREGHKIYAILTSLESSEIGSDQKLLAEIGTAQTFLIETFDYSAITQANADAVNLHIKHVKPSLVIMPSWKSPNYKRRILARVSLIACRGIGTILMYELDNNNNNIDFVPSVIFEVPVKPASIQHTNNIVKTTTTTSIVQDGRDIKKKAFTNSNSMLENKGSKTISSEVIKEKFESHRTLLLEEDGLF